MCDCVVYVACILHERIKAWFSLASTWVHTCNYMIKILYRGMQAQFAMCDCVVYVACILHECIKAWFSLASTLVHTCNYTIKILYQEMQAQAQGSKHFDPNVYPCACVITTVYMVMHTQNVHFHHEVMSFVQCSYRYQPTSLLKTSLTSQTLKINPYFQTPLTDEIMKNDFVQLTAVCLLKKHSLHSFSFYIYECIKFS